MASNDSVGARRQPRPATTGASAEDTARRLPPRAAETRFGATVYPPNSSPDAASPTTTPHTVINREGPAPGDDPEATARAEAEARQGRTADMPRAEDRGEVGLRHEVRQAPDRPPRGLMWYAAAIVAVVVVAALIWAL